MKIMCLILVLSVLLMIYWMVGWLKIGSIFLGIDFVVGRICVFRLVMGRIVL